MISFIIQDVSPSAFGQAKQHFRCPEERIGQHFQWEWKMRRPIRVAAPQSGFHFIGAETVPEDNGNGVNVTLTPSIQPSPRKGGRDKVGSLLRSCIKKNWIPD